MTNKFKTTSQKSLPNLRQLIFCRLLKSLKVTPAMIAIPGVPGNKETSKEIRNRKICTRRGSREQAAEVAGARHKSPVPATSASCARNQSRARKCPARYRIWRPGAREVSGEEFIPSALCKIYEPAAFAEIPHRIPHGRAGAAEGNRNFRQARSVTEAIIRTMPGRGGLDRA